MIVAGLDVPCPLRLPGEPITSFRFELCAQTLQNPEPGNGKREFVCFDLLLAGSVAARYYRTVRVTEAEIPFLKRTQTPASKSCFLKYHLQSDVYSAQ